MTKAKSVTLEVVNAVASSEITVVFNHSAIIKELADAESAQERMLILSKHTMGEIAAVGGRVGGMGESVNEVLNIKMVEKHGIDWVKVYYTTTANLSEGDKTRKKAIHTSLESIRETVQANSAGNKARARDILRSVKEWGSGIRNSKLSNPKGNAKKGIKEWALDWDNMPCDYRRIMNDNMEDITPAVSNAMLGVVDAMAVLFQACEISPKAVLECTGKASWKA
jgi:hypothetical protein